MPTPAHIHIRSEAEVPGGWRYVVEIERAEGAATAHRVRLSWVDHNHWTGERPFTPSHVVQKLLECLLEVAPAVDLPDRFDASTARRWVEGLDAEVSRLL